MYKKRFWVYPISRFFANTNIYTISPKIYLFFVHIAESQFFSKNLLTISEKYDIIYIQ